jgi:hypothetical protein
MAVPGIYDLLTERLGELKDDIKEIKKEQSIQGSSIAYLKCQFLVIYALVIGIVIAIVKLWLTERGS